MRPIDTLAYSGDPILDVRHRTGKEVGFSSDLSRAVSTAKSGDHIGGLLLFDRSARRVRFVNDSALAIAVGWGRFDFGHGILKAALSPDGKLVVARFSYRSDHLFVLDFESLKGVGNFEVGPGQECDYTKFSDDGRALAVGTTTGGVRVFEFPTYRLMASDEGTGGYIRDFAFLPDSLRVLAGSGGIENDRATSNGRQPDDRLNDLMVWDISLKNTNAPR